MSGFALIPEDSALQPISPKCEDRQWKQDDVERAIRAAKEAGLERYRVEIGPEGAISIVVGGLRDAD